jgi:3-oxoadipate enol-lactonase
MPTTTIRGCDIVYDVSGTGPDLIWGHGLTSSIADEDERRWIDWERVRGSHRVVRYDARGHGRSGAADDDDSLSWENLARDQIELADRLGIGSYIAAGASMGCATALHAAALAPARVDALVLAIPPTAWSSRAAQTDAYRAMADLIEAGRHDVLLEAAATRPPPDPLAGDPDPLGRFRELLAASDPHRLATAFRGAATADLPAPEQVAAIGVPTLILAWTGDPGHPVQTAARLQELLPDAELALATTPGGLAAWTDRLVGFLTSIG